MDRDDMKDLEEDRPEELDKMEPSGPRDDDAPPSDGTAGEDTSGPGPGDAFRSGS